MDYARAWLPRFKAKLIPLVLGAGLFTWVLYALSGPPPEGPYAQRDRHAHRPPPKLRPYPPPHANTLWNARAEQVKEAFLHAYRGYQQYAAPYDELLPVTNTAVNKWVVTDNGVGPASDCLPSVSTDGAFN